MNELDLVTRKKFVGYGVSKDGKVWSNRQGGDWKEVSVRPGVSGRYVATVLDGENKRQTIYVHAWVMAGFGEEKPHKGSVVKHRDGDFANNHVSNLYWGQKDSAPKNPVRGERHHKAVLTEEKVRKMRTFFWKKRVRQLAREFGVGVKTVRDIRDGKTWGWLK